MRDEAVGEAACSAVAKLKHQLIDITPAPALPASAERMIGCEVAW